MGVCSLDAYRVEVAAVRGYLRHELGTEARVLDESVVPESLRSLVPLAAQFGIGDDIARIRALEMMPDGFVDQLQFDMAAVEEALDNWLTSLANGMRKRMRSWH
jgi:hypothetical protein